MILFVGTPGAVVCTDGLRCARRRSTNWGGQVGVELEDWDDDGDRWGRDLLALADGRFLVGASVCRHGLLSVAIIVTDAWTHGGGVAWASCWQCG
jgi:hypothetical protein